MEIRIKKGHKGFFIERLDDRNEWRYWLPNDKDYAGEYYLTPSEALDAARAERDREIIAKCNTMSPDWWGVETEI